MDGCGCVFGEGRRILQILKGDDFGAGVWKRGGRGGYTAPTPVKNRNGVEGRDGVFGLLRMREQREEREGMVMGHSPPFGKRSAELRCASNAVSASVCEDRPCVASSG